MLSAYYLKAKIDLANQIARFPQTSSLTQGKRYSSLAQLDAIPSMPLVETVAQMSKGIISFERTAFFGVQHILKTNIPLFQHLIQTLGANPNYIFLSGKGYSDSKAAESLLTNSLGIQYFKLNPSYAIPGAYQSTLRAHLKKNWELFIEAIKNEPIERIVIFDEGGHCFETMPEFLCFKYPMVGIEQTRGGLYSPAIETLPFPLVEVASSAIKRHLESPLIVAALLEKLEKILTKNNMGINADTVFGVIGNGAIGSTLTQHLLSQNYTVVAFDENTDAFSGERWKRKNFYRGENIQEVLIRASFIFGCTGTNIIKSRQDLDRIATDKTLVSCASEDKEWKTALKAIGGSKNSQSQKKSSLQEENLCYITKTDGNLTILKRGFPVNFDDSGESVPAAEIQLTRAVMLAALVQGASQAQSQQAIQGQGKINHPSRIMPHPILQQYIAQQFKRYQMENPKLNNKWSSFEDLKWIETNSGGKNTNTPTWIDRFSEASNQKSSPPKTKP